MLAVSRAERENQGPSALQQLKGHRMKTRGLGVGAAGPFSLELHEFATGTEMRLGVAEEGASHGGGPYFSARATSFLGPRHLWLPEARR